MADWYKGTAWSGLRLACGTKGTRILGVAQLMGPIGCPTVPSLLRGGGTEWAVAAECQILTLLLHCGDIQCHTSS